MSHQGKGREIKVAQLSRKIWSYHITAARRSGRSVVQSTVSGWLLPPALALGVTAACRGQGLGGAAPGLWVALATAGRAGVQGGREGGTPRAERAVAGPQDSRRPARNERAAISRQQSGAERGEEREPTSRLEWERTGFCDPRPSLPRLSRACK